MAKRPRNRSERPSHPPLWLVEGLDIVHRKRLLLAAVVVAVVVLGALFAGVVRADLGLLALAAELAPPALVWGVHLARAALGVEGATEAAAAARARLVPPPTAG